MASWLLLSMILLLVSAMFIFDTQQAEAAGKPVTTARKEDIPFIKCSVCEGVSKQLIRQVNQKRDKIAPKKITELHIIHITENICNMKKEESDWILKLDIVENGDKLQLVEQPMEGVCKTDCKTIERACQEVMGEYDTDVAEYLFKAGTHRAGLLKLLCKDLSQACVGHVPRLPKERGPGEAFTSKVGKQAEMDKLMRTLQNDAPGLKYHSRDDIQNNPGIVYSGGRSPRDPDDEEEDDDDEEEDDDDEEVDDDDEEEDDDDEEVDDDDEEEDDDDEEEDDDDEDDADESQVKPRARTWGDNLAILGDNVAQIGAKVGTHTQKAIQNASKRVSKATRHISTWWSGKKSTAKPSSPSRSEQSPSSDGSSEEL